MLPKGFLFMVAARAMLAYPDAPADTPKSSPTARSQVGVHVDRAWRDHPDLTAPQYATLTIAVSKARGGRVTARLSTLARTLGRTGDRVGEQVSRDLAQLERLGALSRTRTRRGAGITDVRIARATGGYDVIPWELIWAVQGGQVKAGVLRTWAVLDQALGAKGRTRDTNSELAAAARVTPRTVSQHLAQLEQIGLITRGEGPRRMLSRTGLAEPTDDVSATTGTDAHETEVGSGYDAEVGSMYLTPVTHLTPESPSSSRSARHQGERASRATSGRKRPTGGIYANPEVGQVRDLLEVVRAWRFGPRVRWQAGILSEARPYLEAGMAPTAVAHALVVRAECEIDEAIELDQPPLAAVREGLRALAIDIRLGQACRQCGRDASEAGQLELVDGCCDWCTEHVDGSDEIPAEALAAVRASLGLPTEAAPEATTHSSSEDAGGLKSTAPAHPEIDVNTAPEAEQSSPAAAHSTTSTIRAVPTTTADRSSDMTHRHTPECTIEHATWRCYVDHQCRRPECREAWRIYGATRNRQIAYGRIAVDHYVTGSHARAHLERLRHDGMTIKQISRESSVAPVTISRILDGHRTRESTQTKLLAVEPGPREITGDIPDMALVNSAGTRRRLRALVVCGWTGSRIAERWGCSATNVNLALRKGEDDPTVAHFARTVRELYEDLWDQEPPCANRHEEARAVQISTAALERGWAPPMAWDEESIDDPDAQPAQWREVTDLGSGHRRMHLEDLEDCIRWGLDLDGAAERLGVTKDAVEVCAKRAERPDIPRRLRRNAIALHHVA